MNYDNVLLRLAEWLGSYRYCPDLLTELGKLISGTGIERKFFSLLVAKLCILSQFGVNATEQKEFEPISDGIYSIHLAGSGFNIRILYAFLPNREPVLLLAFYERGGKGKTDYSEKIPDAVKRFIREKEKFKNE